MLVDSEDEEASDESRELRREHRGAREESKDLGGERRVPVGEWGTQENNGLRDSNEEGEKEDEISVQQENRFCVAFLWVIEPLHVGLMLGPLLLLASTVGIFTIIQMSVFSMMNMEKVDQHQEKGQKTKFTQ